ncbi:MAG: hypothetical protein HUK12_06650 [Muribaculaceae bacterium]|nr:hypothetical protein [Muribaculaceae bacterium]
MKNYKDFQWKTTRIFNLRASHGPLSAPPSKTPSASKAAAFAQKLQEFSMENYKDFQFAGISRAFPNGN